MTTIQTARYEQFTRRLLRLVGGSIMPRLQNDLSPVINIEDPADTALLFWKGHKLAAGNVRGTSIAAEFASASLFNPLGSGILITVLNINIDDPNTINSVFSFTQNRTGTVSTELSFVDTRASLVSVPKGEVGFDSLAAIPAGWWRRRQTNPGEQAGLIPPVLSPGVGIQVTGEGANALIDVNFQWLERTAETSELET